MKIIVSLALVAILWTLGLPGSARAQGTDPPPDLFELSLEDLASFKVTSVSKHAERLSDAAAAIYVMTADDIRRGGYTSVAEALRMVPGVQVARRRSSSWSIGARGFNTGFSNKMLVLIDGRSVYSPLFAGVFWELQHVSLDDVDRVEVIRGPGGTLWGANAVNGVINVITRSARDTHGSAGRIGYGSEEPGFGSVRLGGEIAQGLSLRGYGAFYNRDGGHRSGTTADDPWYLSHFQTRADWEIDERTTLTFLGGLQGGQVESQYSLPLLTAPYVDAGHGKASKVGAHALARWEQTLDGDASVSAQFYWDRTDLDFISTRERRDTFDLEFQHDQPLGASHRLTWGAGYRLMVDDLDERISVIEPDQRSLYVVNAFVQDRIALVPEVLALTIGTKLEYNQLSGPELQPTARLSWKRGSHTLWTAASRAVRTPTRLDNDARLALLTLPPGAPGNPSGVDPAQYVFFGSDSIESEEIVALEAGYRMNAIESVTLDFAAFYNRYADLMTAEFALPFAETTPVSHVVLPLFFDNRMDGESLGFEVAGWWQLHPRIRLHAWYALLRLQLRLDRSSSDVTGTVQEEQVPHHQAFVRASFDLPARFEFDLIGRYVDALRAFDSPSYTELDARLAWKPNERWEFSIVGQNLLHHEHAEQSGGFSTGVQRGVYGQVRWMY